MRLAASFVAGLCLAFAAAPVGAQPQKAVPPAELAKSVDIPYEEFTLPNGLRVVVSEDHKAPVVAVAAWYNVGSKDEPQGQTGYAHLFEHIGLFNGTENIPGGLMEPLRALGATDWNGTTWFDRTNFFQTVPTAALERTLYMESERMGHLVGALTQERLDNQRGVVQNEKRQGDNQPYGLVEYAQLEALFPPGHPYRHSTIGSMADLDAASLEDLRAWHRENYGPNNAVLVLAGDIDMATARTLAAKYFGHIPAGPRNDPAQAEVPTLPARIDAVLKDRVPSTRLSRTWVTPGLTDPSSADLEVAAAVLGGLASSRLDNELVRGDQTASRVTAGLQPFQRVSFFDVTVDVKPGVDAAAVGRRLDEIIAKLVADGPTQDEVDRVVTSGLAARIKALEPVGGFTGKAVVLAEGALYADDPGFYRRQLAAFAKVTPDTVKATAGRWLTRPVYALAVEPGERPAYQEAATVRASPAPAAPLPIQPREPMPAVGAAKPLDFPTVERTTLANGMPVVYARSTTVPTTRIALEFDAGAAADPANALGLQRLMIDLMAEGAAGLDAVEIAETRERLGAEITPELTLDRTTFSMSALSANLEPSLDLLAKIVEKPDFVPAEIERRRSQQLATIADYAAEPAGMVLSVLPGAVYGAGHPYGRPFRGLGDEASVKALKRDDLVAFHRQWIRPDNATIFIVSDRPLAELTPSLNSAFGGWTAPATPKRTKAFSAAIPPASPRIILIDRPQSPQSLITAALVLPITGKDDQLVLNAANEVIANGFLSRINQDIRETRGWSYGLNGRLQPIEHQTLYLVQAPVQADRTGESVAVLLQQYRDFLGAKGVTAAERDRTVGGNIGQLPGSFETSARVLAALQSNALFGRPDNYWETVASRYAALTPAQLDAAARAVLDGSKFVWVIAGDAKVVRPQLESLGLPVEVR